MKKTYPREVFLNGAWLPSERAMVSVFDRGFLFGDGIYEVIPFYRRSPFLLAAHLQRLQDGLKAVGMPYEVGQLQPSVEDAISRAGFDDGIVYIQVTRGAAPRTHYFPEGAVPTVLLYTSPFVFAGFEQRFVDTVLGPDFRWQRCNIKSISLMGNVLANNAAHDMGVAEYLFEREGKITEGSHTSVFFVHEGTLRTHPAGPYILPGITRAEILAIANELGIPTREEALDVSELPAVSEAFLTGTTMQVTAIGKIRNGGQEQVIGTAAGPVTQRIQEVFIKRTGA